jgi:hypothetical protein
VGSLRYVDLGRLGRQVLISERGRSASYPAVPT